jgi:L-2-hydroxyglutarate oxidase LhgO
MADASVTIIGAGVVGLAVAAEVCRDCAPVYILERNDTYGQEASSRNSEVIHAGIYYPRDSLKARLCIEGNRLLYELCANNGIPHKRVTKIVTATSPEDLPALENLYHHGRNNGVPLEMLSGAGVRQLEPQIVSFGGILSPTTGIISAHGLMDYFYHVAREGGVQLQTRCEVVGVEKQAHDFRITVSEANQISTFTSEQVVNAAGLECDTIASYAGIDIRAAGYQLHYCKGDYFSLPGSMARMITRLVYPAPTKESLGVHAVLDLGGRLKFGPDVEYLNGRHLDYRVDESKRHSFAEAVRRILPTVKDEDLSPDICGIRPKLQAKGEAPQDFVIRSEEGRGLAGFINLVGVDSPGLTASPAIARHVRNLLLNA